MFDLDTFEATMLTTPQGWNFPTSYGINNLGEVAGHVITSGNVKFCTRWTVEEGWQQISNAVNTSAPVGAWDINDGGTVIMSTPAVAALIGGEGVVTLSNLVGPDHANWGFVNNLGGAINNKGQFGVIASNSATGASGVVIVSPVVPMCEGDLDGDGLVGSADLNVVLGAFGIDAGGDLTGDGVTDSQDLNIVLGAFGDGC